MNRFLLLAIFTAVICAKGKKGKDHGPIYPKLPKPPVHSNLVEEFLLLEIMDHNNNNDLCLKNIHGFHASCPCPNGYHCRRRFCCEKN